MPNCTYNYCFLSAGSQVMVVVRIRVSVSVNRVMAQILNGK